MAVHPRACGERASSTWATLPASGSSPRVRGTVGSGVVVAPPNRFIPARAGNGLAQGVSASSREVHPRACGERFVPAMLASAVKGSSPRVRGTVILTHGS